MSYKDYKSQRRRGTGDLFDAAWLNNGLNEARGLRRLRKIEQGVLDYLGDHLKGQLDSNAKQQALFSLLGFGFVQKHFPHHKFDPEYLDLNVNAEQKERVIKEMKEFIEGKVKLGLDHYKSGHETDKKLMMDLREIFSSDLNAELHKKLVKERKIKVKHGRKGRTKVVELTDTMDDRVKFIEATLTDLIAHGPNMDELILSELTHRVLILPPVFRHRLFDKMYLMDIKEEEKMRERFDYGERVKAKLREEGLRNVSDWQGRKAVDTSVILAYERSPALKEEFELNFEDKDNDGVDDRLVFLTRILTIAKLCDENYSPTHIFWLVRASRYFPERPQNTKEDQALTVAYNFKKFSDVAMWSNAEIFRMAQDVYDQLEQEEGELLIKLHEELQKGAEFADATLFSPGIIDEDEEKGVEIFRQFLKWKRVESKDTGNFADLRIFLRKWLSEAFVGSLNKNGASLVWDFLFIYEFKMRMAINVCLALVHLLKPLLETANSFKKVQNILMEGPKVILIRDLRRVLQHFSKKGSYNMIPGAPNVPSIMIKPPSAREARKNMDRRIEALNIEFLQT